MLISKTYSLFKKDTHIYKVDSSVNDDYYRERIRTQGVLVVLTRQLHIRFFSVFEP